MIRRNQRFLTQLYIAADFGVIQLSFLVAWWLKFESDLLTNQNPLPIEKYMMWSLVYAVLAIITGLMSSLYVAKRKKRFVDELWKILQSHGIAFFMLLSLMFFFKEVNISRAYLAMYMIGNVSFTLFYRYIVKVQLKRLRKKDLTVSLCSSLVLDH